ncbi:tetratricopeptide repeat protein, partial [Candidatus Pelagibacter sp.]|nr:tetratricopeptide repeat protein [Candidatus Pelagibacter sp.]
MFDFKKKIDAAIILQKEKKYTAAKNIYDQLIKLESKKYPQLFFNRGTVNFELKNYKQSILDFEKAIKLNNNFIDAYLNISLVFKTLNFLEKSIYYLDQVIHIDKKNYVAFNNRAMVNVKRREFKLALNDLNDAIKIHPKYINALFARAYVHKELKLFKESLNDFDEILKV